MIRAIPVDMKLMQSQVDDEILFVFQERKPVQFEGGSRGTALLWSAPRRRFAITIPIVFSVLYLCCFLAERLAVVDST